MIEERAHNMTDFETTVNEIRNHVDLIKNKLLGETSENGTVIFGAGNCGHKIYDLLQVYDIEVLCFCDNGAAGKKDEATGLNIISPEKLRDLVENPAILISVGDGEACKSIRAQLVSLGFDQSQIHMMEDYFYWQTGEYFEENIEHYRKAYELFDDDFSRKVYLEKMKKVFLLSDISDIVSPGEEEYFDEKLTLTKQEVFVDCGGFDGDTAKRFAEKCGGKYKNIIIFEPESCKKEAIRRNMGDHPYELYQSGVWSKTAKLYFNAMGTVASHISESGQGDLIETASLDETVYDKEPTFIKMDIEGAEQEALKGCRKIIREYRPKLAICVYHKPEDFYQIPLMIKEMNPGYKLYLRQYVNAWYDTVLYAV